MTKYLLLTFLMAFNCIYGISQTVVLHPIKDNTMYSENGTRSNGAGPEFFVGETGPNAGSSRRRALLQFNLSSIPAGAVITDVSLSVTCTRIPPSGNIAANLVELHQCMASWGEGTSNGSGAGGPASAGDATWTCRMANGTGGCTQAWATAGGVFAMPVSSSVTVNGTGVYTFPSSATLIADVKKWVDTPTVNFGWVLIGTETMAYSARGFSSREGDALGTSLTVTYSTAPCLTNTWTGAVSSAWETPGNWSCGTVPDGTTAVIINSGTVILNSNRAVKSFTLNPSANFKVNPGFNLTVTQ